MGSPQPPLPSPVPYTDIEQSYIDEEPPALLPQNQDSNFGLHRKVFCDELTKAEQQVELLYMERWPNTSTQFLAYHEYMMGLPVNPPMTVAQRQGLIQIRNARGPWTSTLRNLIIEYFIVATFGVPPIFTSSGIPLTSGGIPLFAFPGVVTSLYEVIEDIQNFRYHVWIDSSVDIDYAGLNRELTHFTPSGIQFDVSTMHNKTGGAIIKMKGGGVEAHVP